MAWKAQLNGSTVAPCCQDSSSGRRWAQSARILNRSAAAPLIEKPKWSAPPLTVHSPTMRSPGRTLRTSGPTATTSPDHS